MGPRLEVGSIILGLSLNVILSLALSTSLISFTPSFSERAPPPHTLVMMHCLSRIETSALGDGGLELLKAWVEIKAPAHH